MSELRVCSCWDHAYEDCAAPTVSRLTAEDAAKTDADDACAQAAETEIERLRLMLTESRDACLGLVILMKAAVEAGLTVHDVRDKMSEALTGLAAEIVAALAAAPARGELGRTP